MAKTTQPPAPDQELDAIRGKVPGLELEPEPTPEPAPAPAPEPTKVEPPKPAEPVKTEVKPDPGVNVEPTPTRPLKYIPVVQYTDEKKQWNESKAQYESRISELEAAVNGKDGSKKSEEAIKSYAEKYGVDEDSVRDLANILKGDEKPPTKQVDPQNPELPPEITAQIEEAQQIKATQLFDEEFKSLAVPQLNSMYPKATPEQLQQARTEVEILACTDGYLDKSLDYVVYKNREALDKIFAEPRKGPESGRQAPEKSKGTYSADDFKDGKTNFSELMSLPPEDQTRIIETMDNKTYEQLNNWINRNDTLIVNRGGRKVQS